MATTLKRQLTDDEKDEILTRHGRICFATGHEIPVGERIHFDHIKAFSKQGPTDLNNIAPMCEKHNLEKGTLCLYDFRTKIQMEEFFSQGDALTLKDELEFLKSKNQIDNFGQTVYNVPDDTIQANKICLEINNKKKVFDVHTCPITNLKYFYATLPIDVLDSDDDEENEVGLQPRYLIFDKVFNMFRHFQTNPVLQPSIARLHNNRILIFDGQHKIASLLWNSRKEFECKIYINPDARLLNQANISAHDKFAQTRFYSSIIINKLGSQFGKDFEDYKNLEDGQNKSEMGFYNYMKIYQQLSTADINKRFRSFLYDSILNSEENNLSKFVSKGNRGTSEKPLTMDMLEKSIFINFLYRTPIETPLINDDYKRDDEVNNIIYLCNLLYDLGLKNWNGVNIENQKALDRIFRSKSIISWSSILHGAICGSFDLDDNEDRVQPFYRVLNEEQKIKLKKLIVKLISWSVWYAPDNSEIDRILADNRKEIIEFMRKKGLTSGYLMGAPD